VPIISRLGIAVVSSSLSLRSVSGWRRSQNITTSRTQEVVIVPAIVRTCASSERRISRFSCSESLLSRIETKIVGWSCSLYDSFRPALMFLICSKTSCAYISIDAFQIGNTCAFLGDESGHCRVESFCNPHWKGLKEVVHPWGMLHKVSSC
jgi:hypothetical protein